MTKEKVYSSEKSISTMAIKVFFEMLAKRNLKKFKTCQRSDR